MNLKELGKLIGASLNVTWNETLQIFQVSFDNIYIKKGACLIGAWGGGKTRKDAIDDYAKELAGNRIVVDIDNSTQRDYLIPKNLKGE